ncbi:peptidylprolyl isomerase [Massilia sp. W12]|uniref:peptidylprolyl isomerase n=1 Tax=Massilia sp. W12 TaxID=3126507 RepID=UPI0030CEB3E9
MKSNSARLLVALLAAISLPVAAQNLAVVNGKPIPASRADMLIKQAAAQGQADTPELRKYIKEQLIEREVLVQEAEKRGMSKSDEFKNQMEMARQSALARALVTEHMKSAKVSDADIKAEYDNLVKGMSGKEYNARHILVEKEDQAKAIIAKIKGGAKFEDLAKESKDPGSAANGGALDWAPANAYVKEFGDALAALQKGKMTETPVKTQYGFHVIRLDDVRDAKAPALEEVKPQIEQSLTQKKLQAFIEDLKKKAKVQ